MIMTKFMVTTKSYNSFTITMFYVVVGLGVTIFFFFFFLKLVVS